MATALRIPCCLCGTSILPNAANQCNTCLAQQFDLKGLLQKGIGTIHQCRQCRKFERNERVYEYADPESPELLSICLKHIPALNASASKHKLHVVDAIWVWTEPHSMRLKVRLTIRAEIENVLVQQRVMIEFVVQFKQCHDCNREFTNRTWHAQVQLRQKRNDEPKKGLAALEMALARNKEIRKHVLRIDSCRNGFDFYFLTLPHAQAFASFLARVAPMRIKTTNKLVSTDVKNNTANLKHSVTCDMVPLCRDDLVLVSKKKGSLLSGRLALVTKVSSVIHLVDASPKRTGMDQAIMELSPETYYKAGSEKAYPLIQTSKRMIKFVVLDVELCNDNNNNDNNNNNNETHELYQGPSSGVDKYALADVEVARESDFGSNDETFMCVTHLGNMLQPGDIVWGYDLLASGVADDDILQEGINSSFVVPDIVLVKKASTKEQNKNPQQQQQSQKEQQQQQQQNDDELLEGEPVMTNSGKRLTKKKERRQKKQDKKARELEASAARMGFLEDLREDMMNEDYDFETQLQNDPDLAAELEAVERELSTLQHEANNNDNNDDDIIINNEAAIDAETSNNNNNDNNNNDDEGNNEEPTP